MTTIDAGLEGYSIIQNANQGDGQMMSYIITTPNNKVIVIDGGWEADAQHLEDKILALGGIVDMWHITHAHRDHINAFTEIMRKPNEIEVKSIYWNFPPREWILQVYPIGEDSLDRFLDVIEENKDISIKAEKGMSLSIDGLSIDILFDPEHYQKTTNLNDTSLVYRMTFPNGKVALLLGDLAELGGKYLAEEYGSKLKSHIVQMAHHGQRGVSKEVYELIQPEICLWPTIGRVWENDSGEGYDTGSWLTLDTRAWMDEIGARVHGVMKDGEVVVI